MPWLARKTLLLACAALPACVDRPLDSGTDTGTGPAPSTTSASTAAPNPTDPVDPTTSTAPGDPSSPTTADPTTTSSTSTTDPTTTTGSTITTDPSTTTTTDPSTTTTGDTDSVGSSEPKLDVGDMEASVPEGLWKGCTKETPPGTALTGQSSLGAFTSKRAYFGYVEVNGTLSSLRLFILDDAADADVMFQEIQEGMLKSGPVALSSSPHKYTVMNPFWQGVHPGELSVIAGGQQTMFQSELAILGHSGTWDVHDPADPPRLQGTLAPIEPPFGLIGSFDAVFCDLLADHVIAE